MVGRTSEGGVVWTAPEPITSDSYGDASADVGMLPDGTAVIVWLKMDFSIEDDTDLYYYLLAPPESAPEWLPSRSSDARSAPESLSGELCMTFSFKKGKTLWSWIPIVGGNYKFDLSGEICGIDGCTRTRSGGVSLECALGDYLSIEGAGSVSATWNTDEKRCSYVFDQGSFSGSVSGSAEVPLWSVPLPKLVKKFLTVEIDGLLNGSIGGSLNWKGTNFPSWPSSGSLDVSLGGGLKGEASVGTRKKKLASAEVSAVASAGATWSPGSGWNVYSGCFTLSGTATAGIFDYTISKSWGDCGEEGSAALGALPPGAYRVYVADNAGEFYQSDELVITVHPLVGTGNQYPGNPVLADLSTDIRNDGEPSIACTGGEDPLLVWAKDSDDPNTAIGSAIVVASYDGLEWSAPLELDSNVDFNVGPVAAFDSTGTPMVVWSSASSAGLSVESLAEDILTAMEDSDLLFSRLVGGNWSEPALVAQLTGQDHSIALSADDTGLVLAAWVHTENDASTVVSAIWDGADWSIPDQVSVGTECESPTCAFVNGLPLVVWVEDTDGDVETDDDVTIFWSTKDGDWSAPQALPKQASAGLAPARSEFAATAQAGSSSSPPPECCPDNPHPQPADPPSEPEDDESAAGVWPVDPNEKIGPPGDGPERDVSPLDRLDYIVYFENLESATAPVQEAIINDDLSPSLDWTTFQVGEIAFGEHIVSVEGVSSYSGSVDLGNLRVDITAGVDLQTGRAQWMLRTIDPETGELPEDPFVGFLPPNDATHRGEGHMKFSVVPLPEVEAGTVISNMASVIFDGMPFIDTNAVTNRIAQIPPGLVSAPSPANAATDVATNTAISWRAAGRATSYDLYLWPDGEPKPGTPLLDSWPATGHQPQVQPATGTTYRWQVIAKNDAGETPGPEWTFTTAALPPVHMAKWQGDNQLVSINRAVVSAAFPDFFYIEADNRTCGIRVDKAGHTLAVGKRADVTGRVKTNSQSERYIEATWAGQNGTGGVAPLGTNNRSVGGMGWLYDPLTGAGQKGIAGAFGLNNIGVLVRTWGKVTEVDTSAPPTWFVIDDGSGVNVKCVVPSGVTIDPGWRFVGVTGVSSCEKVGEELRRLLRVRQQSEITAF